MSLPQKLSHRKTIVQNPKSHHHRWRARSASTLLGAVAGAAITSIAFWLTDTRADDHNIMSSYDSFHPVSEVLDRGMATNLQNAVIVSEEPILSSELPPDARTWWFRRSDRINVPVLIVSTPFGVAFKTESLLFGPCASVQYAYRKIPDTRYQTRCYDSQLVTMTMPQKRVLISDLVGADHLEIEARISGQNPILVKWIPNDEVPEGIVLSQAPPGGVSIPEYSPIEVEISAGGPILSWPELPQLLKTWISDSNPYWYQYLRFETYVGVDTELGTAYKSDALLFGPCGAVRSAFGIFQDEHYSTLTPQPCARVGFE